MNTLAPAARGAGRHQPLPKVRLKQSNRLGRVHGAILSLPDAAADVLPRRVISATRRTVKGALNGPGLRRPNAQRRSRTVTLHEAFVLRHGTIASDP